MGTLTYRGEGATPKDGAARASELISASLSSRYADNITPETTTVNGVMVVVLHIDAPLPVIGPLGPDRLLHIQARAFSESQ